MRKKFLLPFVLLLTLVAFTSHASIDPTAWNGPSSPQMTRLFNDLVTYNDEQKRASCLDIHFPNLPSSFVLTKQQLLSLSSTSQDQCEAAKIFNQDLDTITELKAVPFYALTALHYPRHIEEFPPIKARIDNIFKSNVGAECAGWSLTLYHPYKNVFQAYVTQ